MRGTIRTTVVLLSLLFVPAYGASSSRPSSNLRAAPSLRSSHGGTLVRGQRRRDQQVEVSVTKNAEEEESMFYREAQPKGGDDSSQDSEEEEQHTTTGLGGMEGHLMMPRNSEKSKVSTKGTGSTKQAAASSSVTVVDTEPEVPPAAVAEEYNSYDDPENPNYIVASEPDSSSVSPPTPSPSQTESVKTTVTSEAKTTEAATPKAKPAKEQTVGDEIAISSEATLAPTGAPLSSPIIPTGSPTESDTAAADKKDYKKTPDTDVADVPADAAAKEEEEAPHSNPLFGGDDIEPVPTFSDTETTNHLPETPTTTSTTTKKEKDSKEETTTTTNGRAEVTSVEERGHGTALILGVGALVGGFLMAISYLADWKKKERLKTKELGFNGASDSGSGSGECMTDTDSSTGSINSSKKKNPSWQSPALASRNFHHIVDDIVYDMNTIDEEMTVDPWSDSERVDFENVDFPTRNTSTDSGDDSIIGKRISGIMHGTGSVIGNLHRKRALRDFVPAWRSKSKSNSYESFDDSSQTSDPIIFEDPEEGTDAMRAREVTGTSKKDGQELLSELYAWADGDFQSATTRKVRV